VLVAIRRAEFSLLSPSVFALIQCEILDWVAQHPTGTPDEKMFLMEKLKAPILPSKALHINDSTFSSVKEVGVALNLRCTEARFIILADFLDNCQSDILPFHAPETLEYITTFVPRAKLHASHQLRFTSGLLGLVRANTTPTHHEMISK
jgi:hypothetical protein